MRLVLFGMLWCPHSKDMKTRPCENFMSVFVLRVKKFGGIKIFSF
jgi:hypothetical protein